MNIPTPDMMKAHVADSLEAFLVERMCEEPNPNARYAIPIKGTLAQCNDDIVEQVEERFKSAGWKVARFTFYYTDQYVTMDTVTWIIWPAGDDYVPYRDPEDNEVIWDLPNADMGGCFVEVER